MVFMNQDARKPGSITPGQRDMRRIENGRLLNLMP
jgi:hypothetical protein